MALIIDTGPLYAAFDRSDQFHVRCRELLDKSREPLVIPSPVLVEANYFFNTRSIPGAMNVVLTNIHRGAFKVEDLKLDDYRRVREICDRYWSANIGFTDAAVLAITERLNEPKVCTLDRRHFLAVRPRHVDALEVLP